MTVTDTFTVTAGLTADSITATTAFSWSKAVASTDTYGFNLANGDDGHIEFIPNMNQICGDLTSYGHRFTLIGTVPFCSSTVQAQDSNACGASAVVLNDGTARLVSPLLSQHVVGLLLRGMH